MSNGTEPHIERLLCAQESGKSSASSERLQRLYYRSFFNNRP